MYVKDMGNQASPQIKESLEQGFSNYGSRPHLAWQNVILGSRSKFGWQIRYKSFRKLYKKIKSRLTVNLFLQHSWRQHCAPCCQLFTRMSAWTIKW